VGLPPHPRLLPSLGLLAVSIVWGTTFVAIKGALDHASPLLFVGSRFGLAALAAWPLLPRDRRAARAAWGPGICLGLVMAGSYVTQTVGLTVASPARSAFITGLNVALVPLWDLALNRRRPAPLSLLGLALCLPGLWLLTSPGDGGWNRGDSWTVLCAVLYALWVVLVNRAAARHAAGALLFPQLAVTALLCFPASPLLEAPRFDPTPALLGAVAFTALLATTGSTWLQLRCQPRVGAARAAMIYATEPVFAAACAFLLLGERQPAIAWGGAALILAGMVVSELGGLGGRKGLAASQS
jgi:drug/metabolite transporter (DMT)-like permease